MGDIVLSLHLQKHFSQITQQLIRVTAVQCAANHIVQVGWDCICMNFRMNKLV